MPISTVFDQKGSKPYDPYTPEKGTIAPGVMAYNNPQGTGSTRVAGGAGVPSPTTPPQKGILGAVNNLGKSIAKSPIFQGVNSVFGTNYGGTNPTHQTDDFQQKNINNGGYAAQAQQSGSNKGMLPPKSTADLHQDNIAANQNVAKATAAAVKHANDSQVESSTETTPSATPIANTITPQQQFDQNQANGKDINGNSIQTTPPKPSTYTSSTTGLLGQGNTQDPTYEAAIKKAADLENEESQGVMNLGREPMTAGDFMGQSGTLISGLNSEIGNQQALAANALKSKDQQITANTNAANLTAPQGNTAYFGSPEGGGIVGNNAGGASFPGATGNSLIDNTVQQALNQVVAGGDPTNNPGFDAVKALNSPQAVNAYNQGVTAIHNGSYNPTVASASAQTQASSAAQLKERGIALSQSINQVDTAGNQVTAFMTQTPQINQTDMAFFNAPAKTYLTQIGASGQIAQYNVLMDTLKKYATQIISAGYDGTPTGAEALSQLQDPSNLSLGQVQYYLNTVKNDGQTQLQQIQKQATELGATGNLGTPATPTNTTAPAPANSNITDPYTQASMGTGLNIIGGVEGLFSKAGALLSSIL